MVVNGEQTGVNPRLCAAVAQAESSLGASPRAQKLHDPFGMTDEHKNYASFKDAIAYWFTFIRRHPNWAPWQTGFDIQKPLPYCATNVDTYARNVTGVVNSI